MISTSSGSKFTAIAEGFEAELEHVGVKIIDTDGNILLARTEEDVIEIAPGIYATGSIKAPSKDGTYVLVWDDGKGNTATEELRVTWLSPGESPPGTLNALTVEEARKRSDYLTQKFADPADNEELAEWIAAAEGLVSSLTGRAIGVEATGEPVPAHLVALAKRVIVIKIESMVAGLGGTFAERRSSVSSGNLASFSAGAYAESYFGPEVASKAGMLDPNPMIADMLWALATEEKREEWLMKWQGIEAPAAMAQSFEWGQRPGGYSGWPGSY
jgi:hypothetical protein